MEDSSDIQFVQELIEKVKHAPKLLVAADFDGTLSELTYKPETSQLHDVCRIALKQLELLANTSVCVISGRELSVLHAKFKGFERIRLIGSHGSEFDIGTASQLTPLQSQEKSNALAIMKRWNCQFPGAWTEEKPHGLAWHYRSAQQEPSDSDLDYMAAELLQACTGNILKGHKVIEFSAVVVNKGGALEKIREQINATHVIFFGDDVTDEYSFAVLKESDLGFKVGSGKTAAKYRLRSPDEVGQVLALLAEQRSEWLNNAESDPIQDHALLSDLRTTTIVNLHGRIVWQCFPRIDSPPIFGALVGGPGSGYFDIQGCGLPKQHYAADTMICVTQWDNIAVTDYLDCSAGKPFQRAGRSDLIRSIKGEGHVYLEFAPRFNFGRVVTRLNADERGLLVTGGPQPMYLKSPGIKWQITREGEHDTARGRLYLYNEIVELEFCMGSNITENQCDSIARYRENEGFWKRWLASLKIPGLHRFAVERSALVIRALSYAPSGAISAAATTSLPEKIGGVRNWDYRYCWPRDSALSASALVKLGNTGVALRLLDWLLSISEEGGSEWFMAPVYSVTGKTINDEAEVREAIGYRGSRPVRIGNLAGNQLQLDVLGPIAELIATLAEKGASLSTEHFSLLEWMVGMIDKNWKQPDSGIWEIRGEQRHYVHSKLMCWQTVERAIFTARRLGYSKPDWVELAAKIRSEIEEKGFCQELNSYVAAYGFNQADAAVLWVLLSGFHPPTDARCLGTVNFIKKSLLHNDCLFRYRFDDSISGDEGAFHICLSWLIEALVMIGEIQEADRLFETMLSRMSVIGLISEEWDAEEKMALGNFPQAYSHLGIINCAVALAKSKGINL